MSRERKFGSFYVCRSKKAGGTKVWTMSRERKFGIFMSVVVKKQEVQKYGQCLVNANLGTFCIFFFNNKYTNLVVAVYKSMGNVAW